MGQIIENPKNYSGEELGEIFLRPSFTGESAAALGLRVLYNTPNNITMNFWKRRENILKAYSKGWDGGDISQKYQKTISMSKVKAEQGFGASDYFGMVYERITNDPNVNLQDLSGTDIEKAEVALFREAIAEDARVTMWVGDKSGTASTYTLFDGLLTKAANYAGTKKVKMTAAPTKSNIKAALDAVWKAAPKTLKALKSTGKLVYFVSEDVYEAFEDFLDGYTNTVAYSDIQMGRATLNYHGVEVHKIDVEGHLKTEQSIIMLSHKDNLVFALNTRDMPEAGVRLWYNPDEMENRQRACFLAATELLDEEMVVYSSTAITE